MSIPMERRLVGVALASAIAVAAAGCGGSAGGDSKGSGTVTLTLSASYGAQTAQANIETLIKKFEAANPKIKIKPTFTPYSTFDNILGTQISSGNPPDLIFGSTGSTLPSSTGALAAKGALLDLSDQSWVSQLPKTYKPLLGVDGKVFGWPTYAVFDGVIYNTTAVARAGAKVPTTWSEVLPYCKKVAAAGLTPYVIPLGEPISVSQIVGPIYATTVYGDDPAWDQERKAGKTTFVGTAGWTTAYEKFLEMKNGGCFAKNATATGQVDNITAMASKKAAGWFATSAAVPYVQAKGETFEFDLFPAEDSGNRVLGSVYDAWSISKSTKNPDAARAWIDFVAKPEQNQWHAAQLGGTSTIDAEAGKVQEGLPAELGTLMANDQVYWYGGWVPGVETNVQGPGTQSLFLGKTTVPDLLKQMDAAWDANS